MAPKKQKMGFDTTVVFLYVKNPPQKNRVKLNIHLHVLESCALYFKII